MPAWPQLALSYFSTCHRAGLAPAPSASLFAAQGGEPLPALPLHPLREGEKYYLALFLTGVYQVRGWVVVWRWWCGGGGGAGAPPEASC